MVFEFIYIWQEWIINERLGPTQFGITCLSCFYLLCDLVDLPGSLRIIHETFVIDRKEDAVSNGIVIAIRHCDVIPCWDFEARHDSIKAAEPNLLQANIRT